MFALRCLVLAALLLLGGCLEVESMEIRVVADRAADRLDLMIVSRGLWSSGQNNLAADLADMKKCRDVSALPVPGFGVIDFTAPDETDEFAVERREFAQLCDIEPGAFFVDEQKRLCFYQFVRVNHVSKVVGLCNKLFVKRLPEQAMKADRETRALIEKAIKDGVQFVTIDGASCSLRVPLSEDRHRQQQTMLWRSVAGNIERAMAGPEKSDGTERGLVQCLRDNDVAIVRHVGLTEYIVGTQGSDDCEYQVRGDRYESNLMEALCQEEPTPPAVHQVLIDKQFELFRAREARLPPAYRSLREAKDGPGK